MRYGYVRVSTKEQNIDRQFSALVENKLSKENIFIDYVSGKRMMNWSLNQLIDWEETMMKF